MSKYTSIPHKENVDEEYLSWSDDESHNSDEMISGPSFWRAVWPWLLHLCIFLSSISAGLLTHRGDILLFTKDELLGNHPWDRTVRFDGSLHRDSSPFKGPPSKEVDKLWKDLVPERMMVVPKNVYQSTNSSKFAVKSPSEFGDGWFASFEGFHYIHCLHNLWKTHYPEYYVEEAKFAQEHPDEWLEHVDHCVDMLRQKLMCDADSGLVTYSWLKNHYNPHPNFNVEHKCRDYNKLLDAATSYGVSLEAFPEEGIRRPAGERVFDFMEPPFDPLAEE